MPRDLSAFRADKAEGAPLEPQGTPSSDKAGGMSIGPTLASPESEVASGSFFSSIAQKTEKAHEHHPYTQTLTIADIESCIRVEDAAFPPSERASREKFQYRLRTCGELSMGIFTSQELPSENAAPTAETSSPVYSGAPARKAALLGHVIATKGRHDVVVDADMHVPESGQVAEMTTSRSPMPGENEQGHQEDGRTLCIHSFAVLPDYQRRGLGKILLKAYLQRMRGQRVADRAALLARPELVGLYEKFGFENVGDSQVTFGGGGWIDMVMDLTKAVGDDDDDDDED